MAYEVGLPSSGLAGLYKGGSRNTGLSIKMPRTPANSPHVIYETLKGLCFIDDQGSLLPWGNDVWRKATDAMQGKISKDYIYLYLSRNSNDVFNRIHGIRTLETTKNQSNLDTTADDSRNDLNWSMGETDCVLPLRSTQNNIFVKKRMGHFKIAYSRL